MPDEVVKYTGTTQVDQGSSPAPLAVYPNTDRHPSCLGFVGRIASRATLFLLTATLVNQCTLAARNALSGNSDDLSGRPAIGETVETQSVSPCDQEAVSNDGVKSEVDPSIPHGSPLLPVEGLEIYVNQKYGEGTHGGDGVVIGGIDYSNEKEWGGIDLVYGQKGQGPNPMDTQGQKVIATHDGYIEMRSGSVLVSGDNGFSTYYGHVNPDNDLAKKTETEKVYVKRGDVIGTIAPGIQGVSTGPHLHYEVRDTNDQSVRGGVRLNPEDFGVIETLAKPNRDPRCENNKKIQFLSPEFVTPNGLFSNQSNDLAEAAEAANERRKYLEPEQLEGIGEKVSEVEVILPYTVAEPCINNMKRALQELNGAIIHPATSRKIGELVGYESNFKNYPACGDPAGDTCMVGNLIAALLKQAQFNNTGIELKSYVPHTNAPVPYYYRKAFEQLLAQVDESELNDAGKARYKIFLEELKNASGVSFWFDEKNPDANQDIVFQNNLEDYFMFVANYEETGEGFVLKVILVKLIEENVPWIGQQGLDAYYAQALRRAFNHHILGLEDPTNMHPADLAKLRREADELKDKYVKYPWLRPASSISPLIQQANERAKSPRFSGKVRRY